MAARLKAPVVELHAGAWCDAVERGDQDRAAHEFQRMVEGAQIAAACGLECHAGHGLDFETAEQLAAAAPSIIEFNIGHFLIGEAVFIGLAAAIGQMRAAMARGRAGAAQ
jgi:pyridoxine 5-phosphate synthase